MGRQRSQWRCPKCDGPGQIEELAVEIGFWFVNRMSHLVTPDLSPRTTAIQRDLKYQGSKTSGTWNSTLSGPITKWGFSLQHERTISELVKNGRHYPSPDSARKMRRQGAKDIHDIQKDFCSFALRVERFRSNQQGIRSWTLNQALDERYPPSPYSALLSLRLGCGEARGNGNAEV
ncbi:hypothetical protein BC332_28056 [Capsicum chinense]|nr:hypothetical protein BC332_28056 [Capsicum chinense]